MNDNKQNNEKNKNKKNMTIAIVGVVVVLAFSFYLMCWRIRLSRASVRKLRTVNF